MVGAMAKLAQPRASFTAHLGLGKRNLQLMLRLEQYPRVCVETTHYSLDIGWARQGGVNTPGGYIMLMHRKPSDLYWSTIYCTRGWRWLGRRAA